MEKDICTQYAALCATDIIFMKEFCGNENGKIYDCITSEHNCFRSFVKTESEVYFSLEDQVVPLALNTGPSFKSFGVFFSKKGLIVDYYF